MTVQSGNKKKKPRFHNMNRNSVKVVVSVYILVHAAFYLSGFLPEQNQYTGSAFRSEQRLSDYKTVSLIRWDYAPSEKTMELVFDIKNTVYSEGRIEFSALYDNSRNLETQIAYNRQDMLVIRLYGIPNRQGKKITAKFEYTPDGDKTYETNFYGYTGMIHETDSLPVLTESEYYRSRQNYDIAYYQSLIDELKESIVKNEASITKVQEDITALHQNTGSLTTDEILNLNKIIENDRSTIERLETANEKYRAQIASYEETIGVLKQRMVDYE